MTRMEESDEAGRSHGSLEEISVDRSGPIDALYLEEVRHHAEANAGTLSLPGVRSDGSVGMAVAVGMGGAAASSSWFRSLFLPSPRTWEQMLSDTRAELKRMGLPDLPKSPFMEDKAGMATVLPILPRGLSAVSNVATTEDGGGVGYRNLLKPSVPSLSSSLPPSSAETQKYIGPQAPLDLDRLLALTSYKVNGGAILYYFQHPILFDLVLVTCTTIESFSWDGRKILEVRLAVIWTDSKTRLSTAPTVNDNALDHNTPQIRKSSSRLVTGSSPQSLPAGQSESIFLTHLGGDGNARVIPGRCAVYLPTLDEVAVGHEDGVVRFYSTRTGSMGSLLRETQLPDQMTAIITSIHRLGQNQLSVGYSDGYVRIWKLKVMTHPAQEIPPPPMFHAGLLRGEQWPGVSTHAVHFEGSSNGEYPQRQSLHIGYENGALWCRGLGKETSGFACFVHSGFVVEVQPVFDGTCTASVGTDEALVISDSLLGRSLGRRALGFLPTCLKVVHVDVGRNPSLHPSENVLLVGGQGGQVEIFRLAPLSWDVVEVRVWRRVLERSRIRGSEIKHMHYDAENAVLSVGQANGLLRRWRVSVIDALVLAPIQDGMDPVLSNSDPRGANDIRREYSAASISQSLESEFDATKLSTWKPVIAAQQCLATSMGPGICLDDANKDALVSQFQDAQLQCREVVMEIDRELNQVLQKIRTRYQASFHNSTTLDSHESGEMAREGGGVLSIENPALEENRSRFQFCMRRSATFEAFLATRRHRELLFQVQNTLRERFRQILQAHIRLGRGPATNIESLLNETQAI
uniref:Uncharacterized protein n=1 Tax=Compsopogon caeruleus TaxID=31354 RepID=A0A7S1XG24_9RHOD|mmetsp:Transcript_4712/g.9512  ORF Transcript_4712/g.9512 Transcript_4712/m.9512 type:complete len:803 (+) Transcript_4712:120-2528(+)